MPYMLSSIAFSFCLIFVFLLLLVFGGCIKPEAYTKNRGLILFSVFLAGMLLYLGLTFWQNFFDFGFDKGIL